MATFAENHSIGEQKQDILRKRKSEVASAVQYRNFRVTTGAIQQFKVALYRCSLKANKEAYISSIITGDIVDDADTSNVKQLVMAILTGSKRDPGSKVE